MVRVLVNHAVLLAWNKGLGMATQGCMATEPSIYQPYEFLGDCYLQNSKYITWPEMLAKAPQKKEYCPLFEKN